MGKFSNIGLFAKPNSSSTKETFNKLVEILGSKKYHLICEQNSANLLTKFDGDIVDASKVGQQADIAIIVGGDGSMLKAARSIAEHQIPMLGINRGNLGFMADILPEKMPQSINDILDGNYCEDKRCLFDITINKSDNKTISNLALNDVVLFNGDVARMLEFELFIDDQFVTHMRSDGIIISTPTGSTAYALSAGGPIVSPHLNVINIVPMCAHTLTSRPIVLSDDSIIKLVITNKKNIVPKISCDGQVHINISSGDEILIKKHPNKLTLLHPQGHDYFSILREKLGWSISLGSDRITG